jgi:hypothetical protein
MPSAPEGSAGPTDQAMANDYDSFAEAYSEAFLAFLFFVLEAV